MREGSLSFGTRSAHSLCRAQRVSQWLPLAGGGVPGVVRDLAGECWDGEPDRGLEDVVELFGELEHLLFATPGCPFALREDRVAVEDVASGAHRTDRWSATTRRAVWSSLPLTGWVPESVHTSAKSRQRVFTVPRWRAVTTFSAWTIGSG